MKAYGRAIEMMAVVAAELEYRWKQEYIQAVVVQVALCRWVSHRPAC